MSLAQRRHDVAKAEARLADASLHLRRSWSQLREQGDAALTPGRVVVVGLLSGMFTGAITGRRAAAQGPEQRGQHGEGLSLIIALLRIAGSLLPLLLPSLAPAFRAGAAAGSQSAPQSDPATEPTSSA